MEKPWSASPISSSVDGEADSAFSGAKIVWLLCPMSFIDRGRYWGTWAMDLLSSFFFYTFLELSNHKFYCFSGKQPLRLSNILHVGHNSLANGSSASANRLLMSTQGVTSRGWVSLSAPSKYSPVVSAVWQDPSPRLQRSDLCRRWAPGSCLVDHRLHPSQETVSRCLWGEVPWPVV